MRKFFRIIYLLLMPVLFVGLMAICLSFEGTITLNSSANPASTGLTGEVNVLANCYINLKGLIFNLENWHADLSKVFQISSLTFTLNEVADKSTMAIGQDFTLTLQMLAIVGIVIFGIGFFISEVGYGSKAATILGTIILIGGSFCIFMDTNLNEGLRYILSVDSGSGAQEAFRIEVNWLTVKLVAGIADGLTLVNLIVVLTRKKNA